MNAHESNLMFVTPEMTEALSGILWKELSELVAASKKPDAVINHERMNIVQKLYVDTVKHRTKQNKFKTQTT